MHYAGWSWFLRHVFNSYKRMPADIVPDLTLEIKPAPQCSMYVEQ